MSATRLTCTLPGCGRAPDHDRVGGDHGERAHLATDVAARIARELGLEKVMFEAADPEVFGWYVKNYGPEVNLSWTTGRSCSSSACAAGSGDESLWGRVTYPER